MPNQLPKLKPLIHSWIKDITADHKQLTSFIEQFQSPINVHNLIPFLENHQKFTELFEKYGVKNQVFFARKANRLKAFVKTAKQNNFGVDTASLNELKECIELGVNPDKITVTAATKNKDLFSYAIRHQVPVILDNIDECDLLQELLNQSQTKLKVGFRLSGFTHNNEKLYSRFGFDIDSIEEFILNLVGPDKVYNKFIFQGFHFHLNGYETSERATALFQTLNVVEKLVVHGIFTEFIDIGGGILMNYLESEQEWSEFHAALKNSLHDSAEEITFRKDPLGMFLHQGKVLGEPKVYPYFNKKPQEKFLEEILLAKENERILFEELVKLNIELRIEPGRSLLDQCGITIARICYRKKDAEGRLLIGLEMNRTQMFSSSADFLLEPIFIPKTKKDEICYPVYFVGSYCLEQELLLKRKIILNQYPEIGDLICFVNTAGYMMHFYESEAHLFSLAQNLIAEKDELWRVRTDDSYIDDKK